VSPLSPGEIRARRRPFVVLGVAALRLGCGFCLALPLASLLAESGIGYRAEGDRALFEGGGYLLLEVVRLHGQALSAAARGLLPLLALGSLLTAACNAALLVALNTRDQLRSLSWLTRAAARLPAFGVLGIGTTLAQGLLLLVAAITAEGMPESLAKPQQTSALQLLPWLLALLAAGALGGFADLTKAALVRYESTFLVGLSRSWQSLLHRPWLGALGWLPYALPYAASVLAAAFVVGAIDVSRPGAWRVVAVFACHQLVVVVGVACRAAWFARALRAVCAVDAAPRAMPEVASSSELAR
jgi:hypothetical protein